MYDNDNSEDKNETGDENCIEVKLEVMVNIKEKLEANKVKEDKTRRKDFLVLVLMIQMIKCYYTVIR